MFSWIPIHQEAAARLLDYRHRHQDLIALLARMHEAGLKALTISDRDASGAEITLQEIDPFTFLANFNRPNTWDNRKALWAFLKNEWQLTASVPDDFNGVPLMNHQKTWLIPFAADREASHVSDLWEFFEHILTCSPGQLNTVLMQRCMGYKNTAMTVLTMGMFWVRPAVWISTDGKNIGYAQSLAETGKPRTAAEYPAWLQKITALAGGDAKEFSRAAYLYEETTAPDPSKIRYWLIAPGRAAYLFPKCLDREYISVGWSELSDVRGYKSLEEVSEILGRSRGETSPKQSARMIWQFAREMKKGDLVFAKKGTTDLLGWGVVTGDYRFAPEEEEYCHTIPVDWRSEKIVPSEKQLPNKTLTEKTGDSAFLDLIARGYGIPETIRITTPEPLRPRPKSRYTIEAALVELFLERPQLETILRRLKVKKNVILQGAPGVGKTYLARRLAHLHFGEMDDSRIVTVQFHQSYSYEDFVEGIRPTTDGKFAVKKGIFYDLCKRAESDTEQDYVMVIDEINRGNLSKILGELMMLIESDKRDSPNEVTLTYSRDRFAVPANLYIIGMMNTADRSLSMVDYALRRRFSFINLEPGFHTDSFSRYLIGKGVGTDRVQKIRARMNSLNAAVLADEALGGGYRIGHSYFTPTRTLKPDEVELWYQDIVDHEILPLLAEYWIESPNSVDRHRTDLCAPLS